MAAQTATKQPELREVPKSPARERLAELVKARNQALHDLGLATSAAQRASDLVSAAEERLVAARQASDQARTDAASVTATALIGGTPAPDNSQVSYARLDEDNAADSAEVAAQAFETVKAQVEPAKAEVAWYEKQVGAAVDAVLADSTLLAELISRIRAKQAELLPLVSAAWWLLSTGIAKDAPLAAEAHDLLGRRSLPGAPSCFIGNRIYPSSGPEIVDWARSEHMAVWNAVRKQLGEDPFCPLPFPIV